MLSNIKNRSSIPTSESKIVKFKEEMATIQERLEYNREIEEEKVQKSRMRYDKEIMCKMFFDELDKETQAQMQGLGHEEFLEKVMQLHQ